MKKASLAIVMIMLCGFSVFAVADGSQTDSELCPDFDGDGEVNLDDYFLFSDHFNTDEQNENWVDEYDLDRDGDVDFDDYFLLSDFFGKKCYQKVHEVGVGSVSVPANVNSGQNVEVKANVFNHGNYDENVNVSFYVDDVIKGAKTVSLKEGSSKSVSFIWESVEGIHDLLIKVFIYDDSDNSNNENSAELNIKKDADPDCFGMGNGIQAGSCNSNRYCYSGSCCGDDANEYFVYQKAGTSPYIKDRPSLGKCYIQSQAPTFCLFADDGKNPFDPVTGEVFSRGGVASIDNNQYKYNNGEIAGSKAGSTWRGAVCDAGVWDELCDVNKNACNAGCGVQWQTKSTWMENKNFCCGDDVNEYFADGEDGSSACCLSSDYFVEDGICYKKVHEIGVGSVSAPADVDSGQNVEIKANVFNHGDYDENVNVSFYVDENINDSKIVNLGKGESKEVSFFWKAVKGVHELLIKVFVRGDSDNSNNENSAEIGVDEWSCHVGDLGSLDYCSADCKCGIREGDCDTNNDCETGLRCATNVGATYGFGSTIDVCVAINYVKHYEKKCYAGDSWWYDSSNIRNDKYADCEFGCSNGVCIEEEPECSVGETKCDETNYFTCVNEEWVSQGEVPGKCGVEIEAVCEDSDGGLDYSTAGDAKMKLDGMYRGYRDSCKLRDTTNLGDFLNNIGAGGGARINNEVTDYLYEAYCKNGIPAIKIKECDCYNGACV